MIYTELIVVEGKPPYTRANTEFAIAFSETNLRRLLGEPAPRRLVLIAETMHRIQELKRRLLTLP